MPRFVPSNYRDEDCRVGAVVEVLTGSTVVVVGGVNLAELV